MACRGIRGATTVPDDSAAAILERTRELLQALVDANDLLSADLAGAVFTVTPDLRAAFPAKAARILGWNAVPLLDAVAPDVPGSPSHCIRVLLHWNTTRPPEAVRHIYLHEAAALRPDLPGPPPAVMPPSVGPLDPPAEDQPARNGPTGFTVAYQGEPGAYSQEAIFQHFGPQVGTLGCPDFADLFAAVEEGRAHVALLPIENSQAGSITSAYDLLLDHDLRVVGEVKLRVRHCLLAPPGTRAADIRRVYSHPQALAQCERYLKNRGYAAVSSYDTAGSARALADSGEPGAAAIASVVAGRTYGLEVLEAGIEDHPDNTTRFFILGRDEPTRTASNKTSIVFATAHTPGALYRALGEFATRGVNLAKIESRPRRDRPWHYVFYVDLEGHWQDPAISQAMMALLVNSTYMKLLGSYPAAPEPGANQSDATGPGAMPA